MVCDVACDGEASGEATLVRLLGLPRLEGRDHYRIRSHKSWAVLTFLLLSGPAARDRLAGLLFAGAEDPLGALRWSLSEIRRALGPGADLSGDPVRLALPAGTEVDVVLLERGHWSEAVRLPDPESELLEGMAFPDAAAFEAWLLVERRRAQAAATGALHAAALDALAAGRAEEAVGYAARVVMADPLDENHQALLVRAHRLAGDQEAADRQLAACAELFERELGVAPGPLVRDAARAPAAAAEALDEVAVTALLETGQATVAAGGVDAGVGMLREAVAAGGSVGPTLRVRSRLALAEALIHAARGRDEEGLALLHAAVADADEGEVGAALAAQVRVELGYVEFLRARYAQAESWLTAAMDLDDGDATTARAAAYLGAAYSDQGRYVEARRLLSHACGVASRVEEPRREAYAMTMLGRAVLLHGVPDDAAIMLTQALEAAERDHWLSFLPWPQALLGEVLLHFDDLDGARSVLGASYARACQLGDPCWEGAATRALALLADAEGHPERAFELLAEARQRCRRLPDLYVWLDAAILDTACALGVRHGHPDTPAWIDALHRVAAGAGMWDLAARGLLHRAALGDEAAFAGARLVAARSDALRYQGLANVSPESWLRAQRDPGRGRTR